MSQNQDTKKKQVISKWAKKGPDGEKLQQVVYKDAIGKNKKGKTIYNSTTKHEVVK